MCDLCNLLEILNKYIYKNYEVPSLCRLKIYFSPLLPPSEVIFFLSFLQPKLKLKLKDSILQRHIWECVAEEVKNRS